MTTDIDDQTVAYVAAAHVCFEDLKHVAGQLAGFLVLEAAGSAAANPDHPLLKSAEHAFRQAEDGIRSLRVSSRARRHHFHLMKAAACLDQVLRSLRAGGDPLSLLEQAYAALRAASHALPGFPMLDFKQGCCAVKKNDAQLLNLGR
jgi:hypothetical protein